MLLPPLWQWPRGTKTGHQTSQQGPKIPRVTAIRLHFLKHCSCCVIDMYYYYLMYLEEYARGALVEILAADRRHTEGLRKVEASFSSVLFSMVSPSRRRRRRRSRPPLRRFSSPFSWSLVPHFATSRKRFFYDS